MTLEEIKAIEKNTVSMLNTIDSYIVTIEEHIKIYENRKEEILKKRNMYKELLNNTRNELKNYE